MKTSEQLPAQFNTGLLLVNSLAMEWMKQRGILLESVSSMAWKDWKDYQDGRSKESVEQVIELNPEYKLRRKHDKSTTDIEYKI